MRTPGILVGLLCLACALPALAAAQKSRSFDHVHFSVPDPEAAQRWYMEHLGGLPGETPDRVAFGDMPFTGQPPLPVQLLWQKSPDGAQPVRGSAIESLGFSFADLPAKVRELEAAGVRVLSPVREAPGAWPTAVVEDPWGVRIELVEDPELPGLHHVALRVPDPGASLSWYLEEFGGDRATLAGGVEAAKYGNVYLVLREGEDVPLAPGYGINHIGWAATSIDDMAGRLRADGVRFSLEPREALNRYGHRIAFVEGPDEVRIELVEHTRCMFSPPAPRSQAEAAYR